MMNSAVAANYIMSTNLCFRISKCIKGLRTTVLCRVVKNYKVGLAQIKVYCACPGCDSRQRIFEGGLPEGFRKRFCLLFVELIGFCIRATMA